jgi:hypothetical protein
MISFDTDSTADSVEDAASGLADTGSEKLQLPTNLHGYSHALQSALVQFLATWSRRHEHPTLVTFVQDREQAPVQLRNLSATVHGMAGLLFSKHVNTARGEAIDGVPETVNARYGELSTIEVKGSKLVLVVADNHQKIPKNAPFVRLTSTKDPAYRAKRKGVFIGDFRQYLARCFRNSNASPLGPRDAEDILSIIYELFANTEEWGSLTINETPLLDSFRGVLAEIIPLRILADHISRGHRFEKHLGSYLTQISQTDLQATHVYHISIFDTGVGLAQRQLGRFITDHDTVELEYQEVLTCLRRHGSSSGDPTRGNGLFEVMKLLTRVRGFLQLRTGRLGLFRNFIDDKFIGEDVRESARTKEFYRRFEYLWDWESNPEFVKAEPSAKVTYTKRIPLDGALFNLWVPLREPQLALFPSSQQP